MRAINRIENIAIYLTLVAVSYPIYWLLRLAGERKTADDLADANRSFGRLLGMCR